MAAPKRLLCGAHESGDLSYRQRSWIRAHALSLTLPAPEIQSSYHSVLARRGSSQAEEAISRLDRAIVRARAQAVLAYDPDNVDALAFLTGAGRPLGREDPAQHVKIGHRQKSGILRWYPTKEAYLGQVLVTTMELAADGYILESDVDRII